MIQILNSEATTYPNTGRYFFFEAQSGKHRACVVASEFSVRVVLQNASHRVWRGMGKNFASWDDAIAAYKTADIRALIETARDADKVAA